jgi:hypothetical protein
LYFKGLNFPEPGLAGAVAAPAEIDKGKRIVLFVKAGGQLREAGMLTHAMKPVSGIRVIGFAAMDDCVDVTAIGRFVILNDFVCAIQMVVPDEDGSAKKVARAEFLVQRRFGDYAFARTGSDVRRLRRIE